MRRVLLGGLGIALGVFVRPAVAQDVSGRFPSPTESHHSQPGSPNRAARLGRPIATPVAAPAVSGSEVTPVGGVIARGQIPPPVTSTPQLVPGGSPLPIGTPFPTVGAPATGAPAIGLPVPRPVVSGPSVTVVRDPATGGVPGAPIGPTGGISNGVPYSTPVIVPPDAPMVPAVGPADCGAGCPQPSLDPALVGDPMPGGARFPALSRLVGMTGDRWWFSGEYLLWWTRSSQVPALVTTSSPQFNGIPGTGDTTTLLGGSFGQTLHSGARFGAGWWFSDDQRRGIDTQFMFLFPSSSDFSANTNQYPLLARPFFNVNSPTGPFSEVVAAPGLASGGVQAHLQNSLWGAEINYRRFLAGTPCYRLDALVGFRYMNFSENLSITETFLRTPDSPVTVGSPAVGGVIGDRFRAENNFYGGQVGLTGEIRRGRWFMDTRATVAFGTVHQTAEINGGQTLLFPNGQVGQYQGGLLALPGANIGRFSQDKFAVMPQVGINLGYHITPHCRVFVGYSFLYLSSVVRAGNLIDPMLDAARIPNFPLPNNPGILPGTPRPAPVLRTTDFWAQGINFGLQWTF